VGQSPLPLLDSLHAAWHPASGQWVLVSGDEDPLWPEVEQARHLGFLEAFPNNPRRAPHAERRIGLTPLVRSVDLAARRHRVAAGAAPAGTPSMELGSLHDEPQTGSIPVWIVDDRLVTGEPQPAAGADRRAALRWAAAPLTWRGDGDAPLGPRVRATGRRLVAGLRGPGAAPAGPEGEPAGYLWQEGDGGRGHELFEAVHPVTGDQLVTPWPLEAADLGYGPARSLGWVATVAPLSAQPVAVPWASRFGRSVRRP
jgi:hypothetical protein